ncbi:hypothetical protein [Phormidesmis priestleyi]|uniref:hypothetical protein n=1 Tax=Phormidesmis priestleyi TaxID=268141 RepID=UPI00083A7508|nr:hypothetical protein [Phormidesmis priestleyi]
MKDAKSKRSNLRYLSYFIYFVCGMLIIYSVVPWQAAGTAIGTAIVTLPLIKQLQTVPLLGLVVSLIAWILPNLMSVLLWALTQLIEITPVLLHDTEIYDAVVRQLRTQQAAQPTDNEDVAKFQKKISHYLIEIFKNIGLYAAMAYVAEVIVNVWYYLPYGNGWDDFVRDFAVWDASLIKWGDFFLMLGSIGIVEILVLFMLNVHRLFKAISPRTERNA